ncbi:MAG: 16S rRNA (cytidine(1402)-2'-O)-methyltransferase [Patescibacteria group bacterium]
MATLYVVATPIGNLEDITLRAIETLRSVHTILAEDTRVTKRLLERHDILVPVLAYHQHSGLARVEKIIQLLKAGKDLALVSDAGTPGINDPGGKLVAEILLASPETKIVPIPGPNAAVTALSASGFPADHYVYLGFPPHKKGRQTFFKEIADIKNTVVFYESKHRIQKALEALRDVTMTGDRPLIVCRELTKQFETLYRGTIDQVIADLSADKVLGEFVIILGPIQKHHVE